MRNTKQVRQSIDLDRLRDQMFRRGLNRRELAKVAGISDRTLAAVFATGEASMTTELKLSIALYGREIVADPEMLRKSA